VCLLFLAFRCQFGSLPSLLAGLWTHHPSAWHFVVPSAAFTVFQSCIGLGVPWVSHGFQARLNETHFWLLQAVAAPYFLVARATKIDLCSEVHFVSGIYWPVIACFLANMLQSKDGYWSQQATAWGLKQQLHILTHTMYFTRIYSDGTTTSVAALEAAHTLLVWQHFFATEWPFQYDDMVVAVATHWCWAVVSHIIRFHLPSWNWISHH
jgi:hypothetical protein